MLFRVWGCKNKTLTVAALVREGTYEKDKEKQAVKDRARASPASRAGAAALLSGCFIALLKSRSPGDTALLASLG